MDEESLRIQQSGLLTQVLGNAAAAQNQAHNASMEAIEARSKASAAQRASRLSDSDAMFAWEEVKKKQRELEASRETVIALQKKVESLMLAIAERDKVTKEWMLTTEAFKRLAREYGKSLNLTAEQRQQNLDQRILDIALEDPTYASTNAVIKVKEWRNQSQS
jgi:hypothetical protein